MPKFLEKKLQEKYGKDSSVPYKIMNKLGFMHGSKETPKGKKAEEKHESKKETKTEVLDEKNRGEMMNKYLSKGKK